MGSLDEVNRSLWVATTRDDFVDGRPLPTRADVVVVGAGIAGLTTARLLADEGVDVVVIDAGDVCAGATGYTTAKVSALQQTRLSELTASAGGDAASVYAAANVAGLERIAALVAGDGIDCNFERRPACTFAASREGIADVEAEHAAALAAGLPARLDSSTDLPFEVHAAVWLDEQAQFHPRRYCLGLARAVVARGGAVADHVRALRVEEEPGSVRLTTDRGELVADHVVLATQLPFPRAGMHFARTSPGWSQVVAVRGAKALLGMYISADAPTRSLRSFDDLVLVGGETYAALELWVAEQLPGAEVVHRWSAHDYRSFDGLPLVGRLSSRHRRTWIATGFAKWGMANATASALILADLIGGRANPWAATFDSTRAGPIAGWQRLLARNAEVGWQFVADRVRRPNAPRCTHLGCVLSFDEDERSWDCGCHGSRFDERGRLLAGPATRDLDL